VLTLPSCSGRKGEGFGQEEEEEEEEEEGDDDDCVSSFQLLEGVNVSAGNPPAAPSSCNTCGPSG
jgi:hypothetical protein